MFENQRSFLKSKSESFVAPHWLLVYTVRTASSKSVSNSLQAHIVKLKQQLLTVLINFSRLEGQRRLTK